MILKGIEAEIERRRANIKKLLEQAKQDGAMENELLKTKIEENYSNLNALYGNGKEVTECLEKFFKDIMFLFGTNRIEEEGEQPFCSELRQITKKFFLDIFNKNRSVALVNILQPANTRVYSKEGVESLKFSKEEVLKGFDKDTIETDGLTEIEVKTLFYINKLAKLTRLREIDRLRGRPLNSNSEENYYKASKRSDILKLFDDIGEKDEQGLITEFSDKYMETFGVTIEEDLKTVYELKKMKAIVYGIKNLLLTDLVQRYFWALAKGKQLSGVQAMGITKSPLGYAYTQGGHMAIIRLKGYTCNICMHLPSALYEEIEPGEEIKTIHVPNLLYTKYDPQRVIPTNVICKVERGSWRHKLIKKECEEKPDNEILKQAEKQIRIVNLKPKDKENWTYVTIEELSEGNSLE